MNVKFNDLLKLKIIPNRKDPAEKGWRNIQNLYKEFSYNDNNVGIVTGSINNILVLDIDSKDNGIEEFNKYIEQFGEPMTVKQKSPNNGYHYFFKYNSFNEEVDYCIKEYLKNQSKYRNSGIDIRSEGGYIMSAPSTIDGKKYEYIRSFDDYEVLEIPYNLVCWLLVDLIEAENKKERNAKVHKYLKVLDTNLVLKITNKEIYNILNLLPETYLNDFNHWKFVLSAMKRLNKYKIFDQWSSNSPQYNEENNIKLWNANNGCIDINYLVFLINKERTDKIPYFKYTEKLLNKTIEMNSRYLIDLKDDLNNKSENMLVNKTIEFFQNDDVKSLNIKSPYDTGKTQYIKKVVNKYNPKRILWVSYRISLTNDVKGNFKELNFKSYLEGDFSANRLIIQLESLSKLAYKSYEEDEDGDEQIIINVPSYDLIIIDEVESVLNQFNSATFKGKSKETFYFLLEIIQNSNKLITLDGDTSNRTYSFVNEFGKSINIVNLAKFNQKIFNIIEESNKIDFDNSILEQIESNKKIVIVSQSRKKAEDFNKELKNKYPKLNILLYTSLTNDVDKMKLIDVNNIWIKADVLIYSPTIEAGVNFDIPHFDKIFGILSNESTSQRSFLQMLARVRKTTDNEIIILNSNVFKLLDIKQYYNYEDIEKSILRSELFEMTTAYKTINNKRVMIASFDPYTKNFIYNKIEEEYKRSNNFLCKLKEMIEEKGHVFKISKKKFIKIDDVNDILNEKKSNELLDKIILAKLINYDEYLFLQEAKRKNMASRDEKILLLKYYFCNLLGLSVLTYDLLNTFYYGKSLIYNFINVIDKDNYVSTNKLKIY